MEKIKQFLKEKKKTIIWSLSFLVFLCLLLIFFTYIYYLKSPFINKIRTIFPLPIAIVGDSWITFNEYEEKVTILENNFKNQDFSKFGIRVDFKTEEGKKRFEVEKKKVLTGLIEEEIVKDLIKEYKISVTDEMIDMEVERLLKQNPDPEGKVKEIKEIWGISLDDYKRLIVRPSLMKKRLEEKISKENVTEEMKNTINQAKKELEDGRLFSDVAKKYSEGYSKNNGGSLGWFKKDILIKEVENVAFSIEVNKNSDIIESRLGFHIIRVSEIKTLENGEKMVYLSQIFVKKKTLLTILEEKIDQLNIIIPVKEYTWKNECDICEKKKSTDASFNEKMCKEYCFRGLVFSNQEMQNFAEKVQKENEKSQVEVSK